MLSGVLLEPFGTSASRMSLVRASVMSLLLTENYNIWVGDRWLVVHTEFHENLEGGSKSEYRDP
jgi:hypothetical protein